MEESNLAKRPLLYDLLIVGAGPAGMTASIYASRYKINHLIFDSNPGGQVMVVREKTIDNYPGVSLTGAELMKKFMDQVESYEVEIRREEVKALGKLGTNFEVKTEQGQYLAKTLILAMGTAHRKLDIPGEDKLLGKGVSYCAVCDAPFFRDKLVAVIGGGDTAIISALHLSAFAQKVYIIHRRNEFRAQPILVQRLDQTPKIEKILSNQAKEIKGDEKVEEIVLASPYQGSSLLKVGGVFIEVGQIPASALAKELGIQLDEQEFIRVTPNMETNVPGIFSAGDLSVVEGERPFRQLITAAADGARAAAAVYHYLYQQEPALSWGGGKATPIVELLSRKNSLR